MLQETRVVVIEEIRVMRERIVAAVLGTPYFRVTGQAGNMEEALLPIAATHPHIVLLDADMPGMEDSGAIERLLQVDPALGIICLSRRWDETAARLALRAGAKGYLVKGLTAEELAEAVLSIKAPNLMPVSEVITLFSPKGSCGKTTLAANLAVALSKATGHKVGLVDADLQFGDLPVLFNLYPLATIVEAARDLKHLSPVTLGAYLAAYEKSIKLLPAARKPEQAELVRAEDLTAILAMLRSLFRYVVVDTAPGFHDMSLAAVSAADLAYVVTGLHSGRELDHLRRSLAALQSLGYSREKIRVVLSRVKQCDADNLKRLEAELDYPVAAILPNQFSLAAAAVNGGAPLVAARPNSPLSQAIMGIARSIAGGECK